MTAKDLPNDDPTIFAPCSESDVQTAPNNANSLGAKVQTDISADHVAWTVSSTAYLRNLDEDDLERECIAIHHQNAPRRNESGGTTLSVKCPALIVSLYYEPREIADRVAAILNAHWDSFGEPAASPWRPIDENTPRDGWDSPIMTCRMGEPDQRLGDRLLSGYAEPPEAAYWNDAGDCWTPIQRPHDPWEPTHWMPMMAAPVQEASR